MPTPARPPFRCPPEFAGELPPPARPTAAPPGSRRKVEVMRRRLAAGRHIRHPLDAAGPLPPPRPRAAARGRAAYAARGLSPSVYREGGKYRARVREGRRRTLYSGLFATAAAAARAVARALAAVTPPRPAGPRRPA